MIKVGIDTLLKQIVLFNCQTVATDVKVGSGYKARQLSHCGANNVTITDTDKNLTGSRTTQR